MSCAEAPLAVLIVHDGFTGDSAESRALGALVQSLEDLGVRVTAAYSADDGLAVLRADASVDVAVVDWDLSGDTVHTQGLLTRAREQNDRLPIWLMADRTALADVPPGVTGRVNEYIYLLDDTADWLAGRLRDAAAAHRAAIMPPMFGALRTYAARHEYSWHTPGHEGGAAFRKSPTGRLFFDFFGEQMFRSDLSTSVGELGSLLDHSGPIGEAERRAAEVFNADLTLFVTNGTSTSNRVVHQASVVAGDVVVNDRNAHKSIEQADTITHAIPVYLMPTRNRYGIIGPILPEEMTKAAIDAKIAASPLAPTGARPVLATVTNSTYDGLLYHVPTVNKVLGAHVDRIHYDEAWYGYAAFNPIYHERYAMHRGDPEPDGPTTFVTQSTHKLLAALSQASYIHVRNGRRPIDLPRLNEAFMMHASTSPLYAIIASNDVAAGMMAGRGGEVLTTESIEEAVAFRKALARTAYDFGARLVLPCLAARPRHRARHRSQRRLSRCARRAAGQECAPLAAASRRHLARLQGAAVRLRHARSDQGHGAHSRHGRRRQLEDWGIPAPLLTAYLDEHASIVAEKTQDFSVLFLFSMGVTKGKWGSLLTTLCDFKRDYDRNAPLSRVLPAVVAGAPRVYGSMGLADLAREMHETLGETGQLDALHAAFGTLPTPELKNADAFAHVVHGTVEQVTLAAAAGRTTAVGVVPYPPGIPLLMPGENCGAPDGPHIAYLNALQEFDRRFPGFEHALHGVGRNDGDYILTVIAPAS